MRAGSQASRSIAVAVVGAIALALATAPPALAAPDTMTPPAPGAPATLRAAALYDWHLAPSLAALRSEVNTRWPNRDRSSDGAVGDTRHQSRTNSHNPARYPGGPAVGTVGSVHALDITARGIDVRALLDAVVGDPRVWYVIHDGQIWSRTTNWAPRAQGGDPHATHVHINLREDSQAAAVAAEQDTSRWLTGSGARGTSAPIRQGPTTTTMSATTTKSLQRALIARGFTIPSGPTGWYGPETTKAVAAFQRSQGWIGSAADGLAGEETLRRLGVSGTGASSVATVTPTVATTPSQPTKPAASAVTVATPARGPAGSGTYRPGTASREVYLLQQALIQRGYAIPAGATGYFGARTVEAVRAFQLSQGWPAAECDGIPGPRTLKLLGLA
jgi:peptidoglycan hydrolase-like protein with peptidoglycan-binding domain